jgi:inner membrane protein
VKHRGPTHWLAVWLVAALAALLLPDPARWACFAFVMGGVSHVLADALTVTGVPFSPMSDRRFNLAGGRLRTGGAGEYGVSASVVILCWLLAGHVGAAGNGYVPFLPNWAERYENGEVTAKEWRDNRFKFF